MIPFRTTLIAAALTAAAGNALAVTLPPLPIARNDTYLLDSLVLDIAAPGILANDTGTGISVVNYASATSGTINQIVTDGSFRYTPSRGFAGVDTFEYMITDAYSRTSRATVSIDASKSVPVAQDDYYTPTGTTLSIDAPGLLANDRGGIGQVTLANYTDATSGTITRIVTDGSFRYTPEYGFAGIASFQYFSVDELGRNASATAYIDMGATIPVAFDDVYSVLAGGHLSISAPGLLANDEGGIGEVIVTNYRDPASGILNRIVTDGSFEYTADPGFVGDTTFTYFSIDALGRSSSATVTISVMAVPEPSEYAMLIGGGVLLALRRKRRRTM